jgi:hypothetical protein
VVARAPHLRTAGHPGGSFVYETPDSRPCRQCERQGCTRQHLGQSPATPYHEPHVRLLERQSQTGARSNDVGRSY